MPIRIDLRAPRGPKPFVDRIDKIGKFWEHYNSVDEKEYSVLTFYGVGGIGKTRLKEELIDQIVNTQWKGDYFLSSILNFDTRNNQPSLRDTERALFAMRNELRKQGVEFKSFDIAYSHYWEKMHPEVSLQKQYLPFINEGSAILDLFGGAKDLFKSLEDFTSWIVGAGMLPKALSLLQAIAQTGKELITKQAISRLQYLNSLRADQIVQELTYFFAYDIRACQATTGRKFIFFLDTFEALWWDSNYFQSTEHQFTPDEWVRNLVAELPKTLWVIGGRNALRWDEIEDWGYYIQEVLMDDFSDVDAKNYLNACGIFESEIIDRILFNSKGVPFALELQVDQYGLISRERPVILSDFTKNSKDVIKRFIQYLDFTLIQTLKFLSVARVWEHKLLREVIREYQTGFPATAVAEITQFSFIHIESNHFRIHRLMQEELRDSLSMADFKECNHFLFNYYDQIILRDCKEEITQHVEFAFEEALYHKLQDGDIAATAEWLLIRMQRLQLKGRYAFCLRLANDVYSKWNTKNPSKPPQVLFDLVLNLGYLNYQLFKFDEALESFKTAFSIVSNSNNKNTLILLLSIGDVYNVQGRYIKALELYNSVLELKTSRTDYNDFELADLFTRLGSVHQILGKYESASKFYQQALDIVQVVSEHERFRFIAILKKIASLDRLLGKYDNALKYLKDVLENEQQHFGVHHSEIITSLCEIGYIYDLKGDFGEAKVLYERAMDICNELFGANSNNPFLSQILNCLGMINFKQENYEFALQFYIQGLNISQLVYGEAHQHSAMFNGNIAMVYTKQGRLNESLTLCRKSLDQISEIFENNHPQVAFFKHEIGIILHKQKNYVESLVSLTAALKITVKNFGSYHPEVANIYNSLGILYIDTGEHDKAIDMFQRVIGINRTNFGHNHYNMAAPLTNLGILYEHLQKFETALGYYQTALILQKSKLRDSHPDIQSLQLSINKLKKKY